MRLIKTSLAAIAALSVAASPAMARPLSPSASVAEAKVKRAGAPRVEENKLGSGLIVAVLAAAAVIGIILLVSDDDDEPTSP